MAEIVNIGNHNQRNLVDCTDKGIANNVPKKDSPKPCDTEKSNSWLEDVSNRKLGLGEQANYDAMQSGKITNSIKDPNRNTIYRYSKAIRACDEAMVDLFRGIEVLDNDSVSHPVPVIWASQEKAVAAIIQENVRKDNSLVVDRIKLPMLAIWSNGMNFNQDRYIYHQALDYMRNLRSDGKPGFTVAEKSGRDTVFGVARGIPVDINYTLYAWTLYLEDMDQILEQIVLKFSPIAYIGVRGVPWEIGVRLESLANNLDVEPGDQNIRVIKYEINMTVDSFIPQPIVRKKSVLKTNISVSDTVDTENVGDVVSRISDTAEEQQ